jgi:hypothetical protein
MASNTVEAVLKSKYEDGIEAGVENTRKLMQQSFAAMKDGAAAAGAGIEAAFESTVGALESWRTKLSKAADDSDSSFKKMSLGAAALGIAATEVFIRAGKAAADFVLDIVKESSQLFEARTAFDQLTKSAGVQADVFSRQLKEATHGQVSGLVLLRDANKILQGDLPLTSERFTQLVGNVFRLSKSAGTDATEAINALTESLIRGNSRALGPALGLHLNVKDAVGAMAAEMGEAASKVQDHEKQIAFYNDLLSKTTDAVSRLGKEHLTLEDVLNQTERTWRGLFSTVGVGILRSGVFQELLEKTSDSLLHVSVSGEHVNEIALATNRILIDLIRGIASLIDVITFFGALWAALWAGGTAILAAFVNVAAATAAAIVTAIGYIVQAFSYLPGVVGNAAKSVTGFLRGLRDELVAIAGAADRAFNNSFEGFGSGIIKLEGISENAKRLASEMEQLKTSVVGAADGMGHFGDKQQKAVADTKELAKQLETLRGIMFSVSQSVASPEQRELQETAKIGAEIVKLDKLTTEQRTEAIERVWAAYRQKKAEREAEEAARERQAEQQRLQQVQDLDNQLFSMTATDAQKEEIRHAQSLAKIQSLNVKDWEEAYRLYELEGAAHLAQLNKIDDAELAEQQRLAAQKEKERQKEISQAIAAANVIVRANELADQGKISRALLPDPQYIKQVVAQIKAQLKDLESQKIVSDQQIEQILKLKEGLEKLNKLNLTPFQRAMQMLRDNIKQIGQQVTQAWGQFFADLVSGTQNAGKKFIAALIDIIAQQLQIFALDQTSRAIDDAANGNYAGAAEHAAAAAALSALGGVLQGFASSLTQSQSSASLAASPATGGGTSTNYNPATVSVGAPGGAQSTGAAQPTQHLVTLEVKSSDAFVVRAVSKDVTGNGALRTLIKQAAQ